jgi:hypothetical protein
MRVLKSAERFYITARRGARQNRYGLPRRQIGNISPDSSL